MSSAAVTGTAPLPESRQVELSIRGMTCAACAARVEKKLSEIPEVVVAVNYATGTAIVSAPPAVSLEVLVDAVEQAGYAAEPAGSVSETEVEPNGSSAEADLVRYLRRRLIVALVFFVPLSDLSVQLSLFPAFRFAGWQWVLLALAAPVAGWAAWLFHADELPRATTPVAVLSGGNIDPGLLASILRQD